MDKELYLFWKKHYRSPYPFPADPETWQESWEKDQDGNGRLLFANLQTHTIRDGSGNIRGLIQYGRTAFGFSPTGDISEDVHYPVIRALCFEDTETGTRLLRHALSQFPSDERVYAFFHYFGMSACARHGKLHDRDCHIRKLLLDNGFAVEHENVYYSRALTDADCCTNAVSLQWQPLSAGSCREFEAQVRGKAVCWGQVHFLPQGDAAYLRWIYVAEDLQHRGLGRAVMEALFRDLYTRGIRRFDTDTACDNIIAQKFYHKTGFQTRGITRSYYTK